MNKVTFQTIENYMLSCMNDSAHDHEHIYRVLNTAIHIAKYEIDIDYDVLIAASLLHDIGRETQFKNPQLCHAEIGGNMAYDFLVGYGWDPQKAEHVKDCISTHRFRNNNLPASIEAMIVFDSDKLEATGALGITRTLIYKGQVSEPIYTVDRNGEICLGTKKSDPESFFKEFNLKLRLMYELFYTIEGRRLAELRKATAYAFFNELMNEVNCISGFKDNLLSILE